MSKKKLNADVIANELQGASLFFQKPNHPATTQKVHVFEAKNDPMTERSNVQNADQSEVKLEKSARRVIRHTFDIYNDQLIGLQQLQIYAMTAGRKKPKLGRMVQKALDRYLSSELKKENKAKNDRSGERTNV